MVRTRCIGRHYIIPDGGGEREGCVYVFVVVVVVVVVIVCEKGRERSQKMRNFIGSRTRIFSYIYMCI